MVSYIIYITFGRFSFRITEKGEVIRTYYHEDEDPDVLAFKNGIVNLLSGRFLDQREVIVINTCPLDTRVNSFSDDRFLSLPKSKAFADDK